MSGLIFNQVGDVSVLYALTLLCFCDVLSGASFTSMREYQTSEWYQETRRHTKITKHLPGWVFGAVWTVLYILVIASLYLVFTAATFDRTLDIIGIAFLVNIVMNKLWSPVFLTMRMPWASMLIVVALNALNGLILGYMWTGAYFDSFWIFMPYAIWCFFALILNTEWLWAEARLRRRKRRDETATPVELTQ